MRMAVIAENICDTDSAKFIIQKVLGQIPIERRPSRGLIINKLNHRVSELISSHRDLVAIFLIEDLHNADCQKKVKALITEISELKRHPIIIQIAIQAMEAWFLALPDAIEEAFPRTKPCPRPKAMTDGINDPKMQIKEIFRKKLGRDYRETTDGPRIASKFNYSKREKYMNLSFRRFLKKISST